MTKRELIEALANVADDEPIGATNTDGSSTHILGVLNHHTNRTPDELPPEEDDYWVVLLIDN